MKWVKINVITIITYFIIIITIGFFNHVEIERVILYLVIFIAVEKLVEKGD